MALFFVIFLSVYGLANYFLQKRALYALPLISEPLRLTFIAVFIICAGSYLFAKSVLEKYNNLVYDVFLWIGSMWFAVLLYGLLYLMAVDLLRFIRYAVAYFSKYSFSIPLPSPAVAFYFGLLIIGGIVLYGFLNAGTVRLKKMDWDFSKNGVHSSTIKVLYFSDLHLTPVNDGRIINQILRFMQETKPDLILMGGDIVDDKLHHLLRYGFDKKLSQLKAPLGVFTCPGNHEYFTGRKDAFEFLQSCGIKVLADESVTIDGRLQIAGRDDISRKRSENGRRKTVEEIRMMTSKEIPVILLDHQPFNLEKTEQAGFAAQLSGHTHNGQMFPINLITQKMYELSWGYKKKGNTHFYVSAGAGTWGPPVKTGSDAEVLLITIRL